VLLLNVLLYRRRFGAHKYAVVALVSIGISMFMLFGGKKKAGGGDSAFGLLLLLVK
jgi:UDP-galactose transporter B1